MGYSVGRSLTLFVVLFLTMACQRTGGMQAIWPASRAISQNPSDDPGGDSGHKPTDQVPYNILDLIARLSGPSAGAHQGDLFGGVQNTLAAFKRAEKKGVDVVEMDLRISSDGVPMVFHDEKLNTFSRCSGKVRSRPAEELKKCKGRGGNPDTEMPTFADVLEWAQGRVIVNAEFKDIETIEPALRSVKDYDAYAWTYFQVQNNWEKYAEARRLDKNVALLFAVHNDDDLNRVLALNDPALLIVEVDKHMRTSQNIERIHRAGKLVTEDAWHFDGMFEIFGASCSKAFAAGVDIAISNRPRGCSKQRDKHSV